MLEVGAEDMMTVLDLVDRLILFPTETGDAWLIDPSDQLAARLARDGDPEPTHIEESDSTFAVGWQGRYRIEGPAFAYVDRDTGRTSTILALLFDDMPPLPEDARATARAVGELRFERVIESVARRLNTDRGLVARVMTMMNQGPHTASADCRQSAEADVPSTTDTVSRRPIAVLGISVFIVPGSRVKNGSERLVVLNRTAQSVVASRRGSHARHVFAYDGKPVRRMLNTAWIGARTRAGLPQVRVHDLKHTFGRRLRAAGVSFEDRQDLLGHRSGRINHALLGGRVVAVAASGQ
jgi:Phage integrase family